MARGQNISCEGVPPKPPRTDVPFEFGADLAQGMQRAGQGATTAAHFFSQLANEPGGAGFAEMPGQGEGGPPGPGTGGLY